VLRARDMMMAETYHDLSCWQLAVELQQLVYAQTATGRAAKDCELCDQLKELSDSVIRHIESGFNDHWPEHFAEQLRLVRTSLFALHNSAAAGFTRGCFSHAAAGRMQQVCWRSSTSAMQLIRHLENRGAVAMEA
jgi:23S rRNA-intervening sequence protein